MNGNAVSVAFAYAQNDRLELRVNENNRIEYVQNKKVLHTSTEAPVFPMQLHASFRDQYATVDNTKWLFIKARGAVQFVSRSESTASNGIVTPYVTNLPGSLQKIAGGGSWNVGASSMASFTASDSMNGVKFTTGTYGSAIGLSHGDSDKHYNDIDFSIQFEWLQYSHYHWGNYYRVWENGNVKTGKWSYSPNGGDVFEVRVNSAGKVEYVKNRVVFYTSTQTPSYPLLVDTAFSREGSKFDDVYWLHKNEGDKVVWRSMSSQMDTPLSQYTGGWGVLARRDGQHGWDQGANSVLTFGNPDKYDGTDIYGVAFKPSQASSAICVGLDRSANAHQISSIDYGWHLRANGTLEIVERGVARMQGGAYAANDLFEVRVNVDGQIEYVLNKVVAYTSTVWPSFPLGVETSFYEAGELHEVHWMYVSQRGAVQWINNGDITEADGSVTKHVQTAVGVITKVAGTSADWNAGARSMLSFDSAS